MKVLFASVIYKGVEEYLHDFSESLKKQSYKNFDLLIVKDALEDNSITSVFSEGFNNTKILDYPSGNYNPSELRLEIIKYAIDNEYDLLVFGDSDDSFSENRIESIVKGFSMEYAFYYNDLYIMDSKEDFFKGKLIDKITEKDVLDKYNFVGMSNSAVNLHKVKEVVKDLKNLKECIAFDWYFYGLLTKEGYKGLKVKNAVTYYRLYGDNIAGYTNKLNEKKLKTALKVKEFQYSSLLLKDESFSKRLKEIKEIKNRIEEDNKFLQDYIKYINDTNTDSVFWWESIGR